MGVRLFLLLAILGFRDAQARVPPKLVKAVAGAGKALYARGYGYAVVPVPHKILLQTNFARQEVHGGRPKRGKPRVRPPLYYRPNYQKYKLTRKPRPQPLKKPPSFQYEDFDEELDYVEKPHKEFEDFVVKHSQFYADGYNTKTSNKETYDNEEGAFADHSENVYIRKPRPKPLTTKLYSSTISYPSQQLKHWEKEEEDEDYEEEEIYRYRKEPERYRTRPKHQSTRFRQQQPNKTRGNKNNKKKTPIRTWDPDDFYHDRNDHQGYHFRKPSQRYTSNRDRLTIPVQKRWKNYVPNQRYEHEETEGRPDQIRPLEKDRRIRFDTNQYVQKQNGSNRQNNDWSNIAAHEEDSKDKEETVPDIITSQNVQHWEVDEDDQRIQRYNPFQKRKSETDWMKEHSVGYGIEIAGGKRKKEDRKEGDVVYGELREEMKPRVPPQIRLRGMSQL